MHGEKIKVKSYSGYKGDELPRLLIINDEKIIVNQIFQMWIEERQEDKNRRRYFEIKGSNGNRYKIYFDEVIKEWFLSKR